MKREIKFRAWDTELKCFVEPIAYDLRFDGKVFFRFQGHNIDQTFKLVLEQCLGINDIYEGDIVADSYRNYVVEYSQRDACFMLKIIYSKQEVANIIEGGGFDASHKKFPTDGIFLKVIGNIHESPSLLTNQEKG